ncbi:MFS transporter [Ahrensia marina]|uniref:MFS transporter n=1 Tax=Ahrensia marina TaxID=1514904 RepID=UPI0035D0FEFB
MFHFVKYNARWLGAGFLLTFASGFGQTWFISLFAGFIKQEHALTDGQWGSLYTVATLASAALLFWRGSLADSIPLYKLAPSITLGFAVAALGMALSPWVWMLGLSLFALRFCGQGMFSHIAMTAMGRWFEARRGQAVAITNLGHPTGEVMLALTAVLAIGLLGWQTTWLVVSGILIVIVLPSLYWLLHEGRTAQGKRVQNGTPGLGGRHWTRQDAARHWLLPALLPVLLTPGFIGTVIFFHQVHVADVKGWTLLAMAPGYTVYAGLSVAFGFLSGWASDRFGAQKLLPFLLVPMGLGIAVVGPADHVGMWYLALGLIGITQGINSALLGVLFPLVYGTAHLGSIRSMATTIMVVSTAIGPGVTGLLIDKGITFPAQGLTMGAWCLCLSVGCVVIARRLTRELSETGAETDFALKTNQGPRSN